MITLLIISHSCQVARSQATIPDPFMRDWLNEQIPGIVDANGIMDTMNVGIAGLDSAYIPLGQVAAQVDLDGIQYLDALIFLSIYCNAFTPSTGMSCPAFPPQLHTLSIILNEGSISLPQFPVSLIDLTCDHGPAQAGPISLIIAGMPPNMESIYLTDKIDVTWSGQCVVNELLFSDGGSGASHLTLPPITCNDVYFSLSSLEDLDLSAITAGDLWFKICTLTGTISWPQGLISLDLNFCSFQTTLNDLPGSLESLNFTGSMPICLPTLPEGLSQVFLDSDEVCIPNWPPALALIYVIAGTNITQATAIYCSVLNSTCPGSNQGIAGRVFADIDPNGQYDTSEPALPQAQIVLQPNGQVTACQPDGTWEIGVLPGEYTITAGSDYPYIQSISPATQTASVPEMGDTDLGNDFAVTLIADVQDLRVSLFAQPARPGFDNRLFLTCQNYGTIQVDAELALTFDGDQTWVGSSSAPDAQNASTATWSLNAMAMGETRTLTVDLNTIASVALGTEITHILTADPIATDETPADNTTEFNDNVVGSYDPNDKLLSPVVLSPAHVQAGETPIEYTIRFQNTGTYLAERVVIVDTLSVDLLWSSMRFIASSHTNHWYITDGMLHVIHNNIMLPDSNSNGPESHGFFKFSMLPATDLQDGATITNIADIIFDFNAPIITPTAIFRVDVLAGIPEKGTTTLSVFPNPVKDLLLVGTPLPTRGVVTYAVAEILGKRLLQGTLDNASQIAVSGLANGVYNLTIDRAGQRQVAQFVKE